MKVICINANGRLNSDAFCNDDTPTVKEGEDYNVIETRLMDGFCWYELQEDRNYFYDSRRFALASDFNVTALVEETLEETEKV